MGRVCTLEYYGGGVLEYIDGEQKLQSRAARRGNAQGGNGRQLGVTYCDAECEERGLGGGLLRKKQHLGVNRKVL